MEERMIKVGITHGDINGISYEIILKTFSDIRMAELCTPIIYGSSKIAAYHRKALELPPLNMSSISRAEDAGTNRVNIINCINDETKVELAKATEIAGEAALRALDVAVEDLKRGAIDVLVTTPVSNQLTLISQYPAISEYLGKTFGDNHNKPLTVLLSNELRVALLTDNIALAEVPSLITKERIVEKLRVFNHSLKQDFNLDRPRIAVLSVNPHAGTGLPDNEEDNILLPAMQEAEKQGVMSFGPYPADTFFGSQMFDKFDGVLAMYHDQGTVPFKTLAEANGLNYTAGLPVIHTAPMHGAAYDIAGQNLALEDSFRQSIYTALDIFRNRIIYKEATRNPLRKQYFDKGQGDENLDLTKEEYEEI
ncbi:4-hydroxythreonine-4-phosphate dehydrogenase [Bacteroidia bacterium]|nr:4-hydroxythreonine-4-phosphate dehydrogenase [Bacteroidia bacterium]